MNDDSTLNDQWQHMSTIENDSFDFKPFPSTTNITAYDHNHNNNNYVSQGSQKSWKINGVIDKGSSNNSPSSSTIISFGNSESPRVSWESRASEKKKSSSLSPSSSFAHHHQISSMENVYDPLDYGEMKKGVARTPEQAQDHVMAERKRREKMTQKFVALSTLIPGLKKLDKATVLGDAVNYIRELQGRVKELEVKGKQNDDSITINPPKRGKLISSYDCDNASSCDENIDGSCSSSVVFDGSENQTLPEIEVRAAEFNVMVRVHCKNQTGVIKNVLGEIEKHNLSMTSSSVMPFGYNRLHMTFIAQVDAGCELTPKDLADNLRRTILNLV
ncbi:basic helix-loop-helix transcription factor [Lithospermum erythrorhizon]|uniref:Basic helix-loop-helix transcription factor n=1 Tax=Lithospermum erythrorhizon TaxID=34254 RepID=A0AAV3RIW5_LITER